MFSDVDWMVACQLQTQNRISFLSIKVYIEIEKLELLVIVYKLKTVTNTTIFVAIENFHILKEIVFPKFL